MCQAFSLLITKSKKIYWKVGVDSHDKLHSLYVKKDKELKDDKEPPNNTFARIEIRPKDDDYLNLKQRWVYQIDDNVVPEWLDKSYEKPCYQALKEWQKRVYSQIDLKGLKNPINPFKIKPPRAITTRHLKLLAKWASIRDSVWDSVGASVGASIRDSIRDSIGASVRAFIRDSVWDSVWASVGAYTGSFFPKIKKWQYCSKVKEKGYPFKSVVKLWKMGLVPSYDSYNEVWRLHGGRKAKILYEISKKELKKYR